MSQTNFSKDFACCHHEYLPCRFSYLDGDVYRCSYDRLWVLANWINQDEETGKSLIKQACPPIKEEEKFKDFLIKLNKEHAEDIIENAEIDDMIFCFIETAGDGEVTLLEKPENYMGQCLYRNQRGEIKSCQVGHCRTLSKGNYTVEHFIEGDNSEIQSLMIKRMALQAGFRVEIQKTDSGLMIKIFGDSQQEVDDFMIICVYNKFIIF